MIRRAGEFIDPFIPAEGPPPQTLVSFIRWGLRGSFPVLGLAALISVAAGAIEVVTALLLGRVIDTAVDSSPETYFDENAMVLVAALGFFLVLRPFVLGVGSMMNSVVVSSNVNPMVLSRLHRWTLGQAVTFFDNDFAGRIAQKQLQTSRALTDATAEVINVVFFALASLVGSTLLLTTIDWRVAICLGVWLCLYGLLISWFVPRIRVRSKARAAARAMVSGQVVDTITNIKTVKLFAHADFEESAALGAIRTFREKALDWSVVAASFRFLLMTLAGVLPVLLIGGTLWLWSLGIASPGDIAAAGAVSIRLAQMTGWVSHTLMAIYGNVGEVEDGMRTLTPYWTLVDAADAVELVMTEPRIVFDNVSFAYGRQAGGVQGINLDIAPGEKIGLVGASGAGKSTLVSVLLRLYDVEGGRVMVSGQDVRDVTQESLRRQIGMVTQETGMFNRSVRDNILFGRTDASDDEIIDAARRAEAHEFILGLEDHAGRKGYDAHLGERGVRLSGGQRQRIALARAILKDAPILVLDEATSALDSEVEASIQAALETLMVGKTVLAIAHRLSTISQMDRIVVLDDGQIVETGTHNELLARGGVYAKFWDHQSGGFFRTEEAAE